MGEAHGPARVHGRHEAAAGGALSHDRRESTADDDAVRADCPRVDCGGAGAVPRAARPDLAVLPGPDGRSAARPARVAGVSCEHARRGEDARRDCRTHAHEPAGDLVAPEAPVGRPLPAFRTASAGRAIAPLHDSRGILRHLARDEPLARRPHAASVPPQILQALLSEHRGPREEAHRAAREAPRRGGGRRATGSRLPERSRRRGGTGDGEIPHGEDVCPTRSDRAGGGLRARSRAPCRRRREPVNRPRHLARITRSGLSLRDRGHDRGLGEAPERRSRSVRPSSRGNGRGAYPARVLRNPARVPQGCGRERGRCRRADRAAPADCDRVDGTRALEGMRRAAAPDARRGEVTGRCEACRKSDQQLGTSAMAYQPAW